MLPSAAVTVWFTYPSSLVLPFFWHKFLLTATITRMRYYLTVDFEFLDISCWIHVPADICISSRVCVCVWNVFSESWPIYQYRLLVSCCWIACTFWVVTPLWMYNLQTCFFLCSDCFLYPAACYLRGTAILSLVCLNLLVLVSVDCAFGTASQKSQSSSVARLFFFVFF